MTHRLKKRERTQNWSQEEKILLLKLCEDKLDVLETKRSDQMSIAKKSNAWREIRAEFVAALGIDRDLSRLKEQWQRMKCQARSDLQDFAMRLKRYGPQIANQKRPNHMSTEVWRVMEIARKHFLHVNGAETEEDSCTKEINWSLSQENFMPSSPNHSECDTAPSLLCETEVKSNLDDSNSQNYEQSTTNNDFVYLPQFSDLNGCSSPNNLQTQQAKLDYYAKRDFVLAALANSQQRNEPMADQKTENSTEANKSDNDSINRSLMLFFEGKKLEQQKRLQLMEEQMKTAKIHRETAEIQMQIAQQQLNSTCGLTSNRDEKVVIGFSTSDIRIWGMGNTLLPCTRIANNASRITLACDKLDNMDYSSSETSLTCSGAAILRGHGASVQDVRIVSEADVLLSVSQDCTMRAWKFSDYSCAAIYRGHNYPIWCLDTSSLGIYIATGSADKSVKIWSLERVFPVRICAGHTKDVNCVSFHPNGSYMASGSADKSVRMWSVLDGKTVRLLVGHSESIYSIAFSPDGHYIASAGEDNSIKIWDLTGAKQLTELANSSSIVHHLCWSKNGSHLASASSDGCVKIWDANMFLRQGASYVEPCSVYNTGSNHFLSLKYDERWLTCLSATTTF